MLLFTLLRTARLRLALRLLARLRLCRFASIWLRRHRQRTVWLRRRRSLVCAVAWRHLVPGCGALGAACVQAGAFASGVKTAAAETWARQSERLCLWRGGASRPATGTGPTLRAVYQYP